MYVFWKKRWLGRVNLRKQIFLTDYKKREKKHSKLLFNVIAILFE